MFEEELYILLWRPIFVNGEETNYDVSTLGEIRNRLTGKTLSPFTDKDGYFRCTIALGPGKSYKTMVHRYVAIAFVPNPENKPEVNHQNGKKKDNYFGNLEWSTTKENVQHAYRTGLKSARKGTDNSLSTYTEKQIRKVCKLLEKGISNKKISQETGVERKYITDVKKGRRWKHISDEYNFKKKIHSDELKEAIMEHLKKQMTPKLIIRELNMPNTQASISLIERLKRNNRASLNDYLLRESTATS